MTGCRPLKSEEVDRILRHCQSNGLYREGAWISLMAFGGWRISSVLSLKVKDVYENGDVADELYVARQHMKGKHSGRRIPIHETARKFLRLHLLAQQVRKGTLDAEDYLFQGRKGNNSITRQHADRTFSAICQDLQIGGKTGTHSLKKYFTMQVYEALERDLISTCKATGHSSLNSLIYYIQNCEDSEIVDAIRGIKTIEDVRRLRVVGE